MDTYLGTLRAKLAAAPFKLEPGKINAMAELMQILGGGRYGATSGGLMNFGPTMSQWAKTNPGWAIGSGLVGLHLLPDLLGGVPIIGNMFRRNQR